MKARLSMEAFRDIATVCAAYERGRITASKARELCERIAIGGKSLADIDPREIGGGECDAVLWLMQRSRNVAAAPRDVDAVLGIGQHRAAMLLSRMANRGQLSRVGRGQYVLRQEAE